MLSDGHSGEGGTDGQPGGRPSLLRGASFFTDMTTTRKRPRSKPQQQHASSPSTTKSDGNEGEEEGGSRLSRGGGPNGTVLERDVSTTVLLGSQLREPTMLHPAARGSIGTSSANAGISSLAAATPAHGGRLLPPPEELANLGPTAAALEPLGIASTPQQPALFTAQQQHERSPQTPNGAMVPGLLLPPKAANVVYTVVLDLDETVVFGRNGRLEGRAFLCELLDALAQEESCEVVVWTAGVREYAKAIVRELHAFRSNAATAGTTLQAPVPSGGRSGLTPTKRTAQQQGRQASPPGTTVSATGSVIVAQKLVLKDDSTSTPHSASPIASQASAVAASAATKRPPSLSRVDDSTSGGDPTSATSNTSKPSGSPQLQQPAAASTTLAGDTTLPTAGPTSPIPLAPQQQAPPRHTFQHLVYRDPSWFDARDYTKDLRLLGRDLDYVVIVENTPDCVRENPQNGIIVEDFEGMGGDWDDGTGSGDEGTAPPPTTKGARKETPPPSPTATGAGNAAGSAAGGGAPVSPTLDAASKKKPQVDHTLLKLKELLLGLVHSGGLKVPTFLARSRLLRRQTVPVNVPKPPSKRALAVAARSAAAAAAAAAAASASESGAESDSGGSGTTPPAQRRMRRQTTVAMLPVFFLGPHRLRRPRGATTANGEGDGAGASSGDGPKVVKVNRDKVPSPPPSPTK